jgi:creatinine amidohydrolase
MHTSSICRYLLTLLAMLACIAGNGQPAKAQGFIEAEMMVSLHLEEMTWPEIQNAIQYGYTNVIIPTAGIEQNGPHMPLYKNRKIVRANAHTIARELGTTLIAPVIDFVPEGDIQKREGHMNYAGTLSMPAKVSADIIEHTIRSLAAHGFRQFFLIGNNSGIQPVQEQVAKALRKSGIAVYHIGDYYARDRQEEALRKYGYDANAIGGHGGLRDTSEFMAVAPDEVRTYQLGVIGQDSLHQYGVWGDTSKATSALGKALAQVKTDRAMAQICREAPQKPANCRR